MPRMGPQMNENMNISIDVLQRYLFDRYGGWANEQGLFLKLVEELGEVAEVINMLPVLSERLNMKKGMMAVMVAFAIGKLVGAWVHLIGGV